MELALLSLLASLAAPAESPAATPGAAPERTWNFDSDRVGEPARGFSVEAGEWKVAADPEARSPGNVFAQLASSPSSTFNLALATDTSYRDLDLSVELKRCEELLPRAL